MSRIGIMGYYDAANFGDDLMSFIVATLVQKKNHTPIILSKSATVKQLGFQTCDSVKELVERCDAIVLGGGGLLQELHSKDPASLSSQFSKNLLTAVGFAANKNIPLYAVSIGGDATGAIRALPCGIVAYLTSKQFRYATVRLSADKECLDYLNAPAAYVPDIVLGIAQLLPSIAKRESHQRIDAVGVQDAPRYHALSLIKMSRSGKLPSLVFIHSHAKVRDEYMQKVPESRSFDHFLFSEGMESSIKFIGSLQGIFASRLHLGVTGLALGVPFYTIAASKKVEMFFSDLSMATPAVGLGLKERLMMPAFAESIQTYDRSFRIQEACRMAVQHESLIERACELG